MSTSRPLIAVVISISSLMSAAACSKKGTTPESEMAPAPLAEAETIPAEPDQELAEVPAEETPAPTPLTDAQIAKVLEAVDTGEIEQAKIAQKKSKNSKVKKYAAELIQGHTKAKQKTAKLAKKAKLTPEDSPVAAQLTGKATEQLESLKAADAKTFDNVYLEGQAQQHQTVLDLVNAQLIPAASHDELKSLLGELKTMLEKHASSAKELQASLTPVGADAAAGTP
jgi:putative membrane protein